jgi:hypothetical protein
MQQNKTELLTKFISVLSPLLQRAETLPITGIVKSRTTSILDCDFNIGQIIFINASTVGFDNTRNIALSDKFKGTYSAEKTILTFGIWSFETHHSISMFMLSVLGHNIYIECVQI